jgi:hypothetical protein
MALVSGMIFGANMLVYHQGYLIPLVAAAFIVSSGFTTREIVYRLSVFTLSFAPFAIIAFAGFIDELNVKSYALGRSPLRPDLEFSERVNYIFEYAWLNLVRVYNLLFNMNQAVGDHFVTPDGAIFPLVLIFFASLGLVNMWWQKKYRLFSLSSSVILAIQLIIAGVHDPRFFVMPFFIFAIHAGFGLEFVLNVFSSKRRRVVLGIAVTLIVTSSVANESEKIHKILHERPFSREHREFSVLARMVYEKDDTAFLCPVPQRYANHCYLSACALLLYFQARADSISYHEIDMNKQSSYCESLMIATPEERVNEQVSVLLKWKELEDWKPEGFFLVGNQGYMQFEVYQRQTR